MKRETAGNIHRDKLTNEMRIRGKLNKEKEYFFSFRLNAVLLLLFVHK